MHLKVGQTFVKTLKMSIIAVSENDHSTTIHVGPEVDCNEVDNINVRNAYICCTCHKKNPVILTTSNTCSFEFGALLENICCCISSASERPIVIIVLIIMAIGTTIGGLLGMFWTFLNSSYFLFFSKKVQAFFSRLLIIHMQPHQHQSY